MIASTQTNQPFAPREAVESSSGSYLENSLTALRKAGLRITQSRIQLLSVLGRTSEPLSVEELHSSVGKHGCDLVTIYRSMLVFEEFGLVQRSYRYNGTTVFEPKTDAKTRYRVFCKESKRFDELSPELSESVRHAIYALEETLRAQGYTSVTHVLEFFAVTPQTANRLVEARSRNVEFAVSPQ